MIEIQLDEEMQRTYDILEEIGSGGGGTIYKAYHKRLQKYVVLKKIHSEIQQVANIRIETDILKNLHHYYLPQVLDFLVVNNSVYTVMDFIPGESFETLLKNGKRFTKEQIMKYTQQLCEAVAYLHTQEPPIIHGDIKPANIMLTPEDNICLIDFNISGFLTNGNMQTVGFTPGYCAPEQYRAIQALRESMTNCSEDSDATVILPQNNSDATVILPGNNADATVILPGNDSGDSNQTMLLPGMNKDAGSMTENDLDATMILPGMEADAEKSYQTGKEFVCNSADAAVNEASDVYSIAATLYHIATGVRPSAEPSEMKPVNELNPQLSEGLWTVFQKALNMNPTDRFHSAQDMLKAVRNIHLYDKNYHHMVVKQRIVYLLVGLLIIVSGTFIMAGRQRMQVERQQKYHEMINQLENLRTEKSDEFENLYEEAIAFMPDQIDAYLQKAMYLTDAREYEECITYIDTYVLQNTLSYNDRKDDIYYLLGNAFFEMEDYTNACQYYQIAIEEDYSVSQYYVDYAIALARCDKADRAAEILEKGQAAGMTDDNISLVHGEIEASRGNYENAIVDFANCLSITENEKTKLQAYIMSDRAYREMGATEDNLLEARNLLEQALTNLKMESQLLVLEHLAQDYIDLGSVTENTDYDKQAITVFEKIIQYGWDNDTTHINIAILCEKTGDYDRAKEELQKVLEADANNYSAYKRLAMLEIDIQDQLPNIERNYEQFKEYYDKAKELYDDSMSDVEIQWLDTAYQKLVSGGWL